ncbi:MAG: hypothetical protein IJ284_01800 [Clostridia bacterium]|nr:hypothetical protein [Clostridia bacterium]
MESTLNSEAKRKEYLFPVVRILTFDCDKDILCLSNESNDNDFDAGGLAGNF